jgi:asparagine synthase (glutamine-hydrolysing)
LDIASGLVVGKTPGVAALVGGSDGQSPREALEAVIIDALRRPPCVVSFSGGRDSSAILALAVQLARREGFAMPVPVTIRFPDASEAEENSWQELVVAHLGVPEWERLTISDELDVLGPLATAILQRYGVLYPCNCHFHVPILNVGRGGSLLSGVGGDELMGAQLWGRVAAVLYRSDSPRPSDALRIAAALSPGFVRGQIVNVKQRLSIPWLRPDVENLVRRRAMAWFASQPIRFDRALQDWWWPSRYVQVGSQSLELIAREYDVEIHQPLSDPRVFVALAAERGPVGYRTRSEAMADLFGDLLPPKTVTRTAKASFDSVVFGHYSRDFVRQWSGIGLPEDLVDPEQLRDAWAGPDLDMRNLLLFQGAWLAERGLPTTRATVDPLAQTDP